MAATAEATRLTSAHRLAQLRLGVAGARQTMSAWPLLDPHDLDGTFARWLTVVTRLTEAQRQASASLAAAYYAQFRAAEIPDAPAFTPTLATAVDTDSLTAGLVVTGPAALRGLGGAQLARAADTARVETARVSMMHALDGGRATVNGAVTSDRRAIGWARVASATACAFCSMLASRGPVYSADTVDFETHRGCGCGTEPVFREDAAWPVNSREHQQMWNASGASGPDALNTFRRHLASVRS